MANALDRVESYQYPSGHIGHLTPHQLETLDKFKKLCEENGYYKPATSEGGRASHDDETMLRYLRARRFSPKEAWGQFKDTEDLRRETKLDDIYDTIDIQDYENTRRLYPQWTGRRDRRGIPLYVFQVADLDSKTVSAYEQSIVNSEKEKGKPNTGSRNVPTKMLRLFALYENLCRFVMPLCSSVTDRPNAETPITQSNNIVDISKVGLGQFWNLKSHMQAASQLATAHYPETLDRIFIIGAPTFFPTVWGWIKRWFDPITVSKIFILSSSNMKKTLETYIDPANIPKKYGGQLDFEWGMMPILEPALADALEWETPFLQNGQKTIPTGPIKWKEDADGKLRAYAVGTEKGKPRDVPLGALKLPFKGMRGVLGPMGIVNTDTSDLPATTSGTDTQPAHEGDLYFGTHPGDATPPPDKALFSDSSKPVSEIGVPSDSQPVSTFQPNEETSGVEEVRTGTSETRYADQKETHAEGQLKDGTPHTAVNYHGHGDKTVTMEPRTVGQAPKDPDLPRGIEEPKDTGYVAQAKDAASQAYSAGTNAVTGALAAVGLAEKPEVTGKKEEGQEEKVKDERVEKLANPDVEEFLRSKYTSSNGNGTA